MKTDVRSLSSGIFAGRELRLYISYKRGQLMRKFLRLSERDQLTLSRLNSGYPIKPDYRIDEVRYKNVNKKPISISYATDNEDGAYPKVTCDFVYFSTRVHIHGETVKECCAAFDAFLRVLSRPMSALEWEFIGEWVDEYMTEGANISAWLLKKCMSDRVSCLVQAFWNADGCYYGKVYNG